MTAAMTLDRTKSGGRPEVTRASVARASPPRVAERAVAELFVCTADGAGVVGVHVRTRRRRVERQVLRPSGAADGGRLREQIGRACVVVGLLPKSLYLLRTLEVPRVLPQELPAMLRLEVLASLPPEMKVVENSYRLIPARKEGYDRYEAYVARREDLDTYVRAMARAGVAPDVLLPTAVCWGALAASNDGASPDMLVVGWRDGNLEAASVGSDGSVSVRALQRSAAADPAGANGRLLMECIRSLIPRQATADEPLTIAWLAAGCPSGIVDGRVRFKRLQDDEQNADGDVDEFDRLVRLAAAAVARCPSEMLAAANLLPADVLHRRQHAAMRRTATFAGACLVAASAMAFAALRVEIHRGHAGAADLSDRIAGIKTEGDAVGLRLGQLRAVRGATLTRDDFARVIAGLADATPPEVSYGSVELNAAGRVRLQGQAASLSMPFLLPERLEKLGPFVDVLLQDAGQTKKGDGPVAEFRIECRLKREGPK